MDCLFSPVVSFSYNYFKGMGAFCYQFLRKFGIQPPVWWKIRHSVTVLPKSTAFMFCCKIRHSATVFPKGTAFSHCFSERYSIQPLFYRKVQHSATVLSKIMAFGHRVLNGSFSRKCLSKKYTRWLFLICALKHHYFHTGTVLSKGLVKFRLQLYFFKNIYPFSVNESMFLSHQSIMVFRPNILLITRLHDIVSSYLQCDIYYVLRVFTFNVVVPYRHLNSLRLIHSGKWQSLRNNKSNTRY